MTQTVTVANTSGLSMQIQEQPPAEHVGIVRGLLNFIIHGNRHQDAVGGIGFTHGVDKKVFEDWLEQHPDHASIMYAMSQEDYQKHVDLQASHGFEPGLAKLADDPDQTALAEKGSATTHPAPVTDTELAAASAVPDDDSPRSQTRPASDAPGSIPAHDPVPGEDVPPVSPTPDTVPHPIPVEPVSAPIAPTPI